MIMKKIAQAESILAQIKEDFKLDNDLASKRKYV